MNLKHAEVFHQYQRADLAVAQRVVDFPLSTLLHAMQPEVKLQCSTALSINIVATSSPV